MNIILLLIALLGFVLYAIICADKNDNDIKNLAANSFLSLNESYINSYLSKFDKKLVHESGKYGIIDSTGNKRFWDDSGVLQRKLCHCMFGGGDINEL